MTSQPPRSSSGSIHRFAWPVSIPRAGLVAVALVVSTATGPPDPAFAAVARPAATGKIAVQLSGMHAGFVHATEGGNAFSEVVTEPTSTTRYPEKHLSSPQFEPIVIEFGPGMSRAWCDWLSSAFDGKIGPRDGALVFLDAMNRVQSRMDFSRASIVEMTFPALDKASKVSAYVTVKLLPEKTVLTSGDGSVYKTDTVKVARLPSSSFRLRIDGVEPATENALTIEALTFKFPPPAGVDDRRDAARAAPTVEVPALTITLPQAHADPLTKWHEEFVVRGLNSQDHEKSGTLEWLTMDRASVLGSLEFSNLGIFRLAPERTKVDGVRRLKAEMYCERVVAKLRGLEPVAGTP